jgi:hypothetical protein
MGLSVSSFSLCALAHNTPAPPRIPATRPRATQHRRARRRDGASIAHAAPMQHPSITPLRRHSGAPRKRRARNPSSSIGRMDSGRLAALGPGMTWCESLTHFSSLTHAFSFSRGCIRRALPIFPPRTRRGRNVRTVAWQCGGSMKRAHDSVDVWTPSRWISPHSARSKPIRSADGTGLTCVSVDIPKNRPCQTREDRRRPPCATNAAMTTGVQKGAMVEPRAFDDQRNPIFGGMRKREDSGVSPMRHV